MRPLLFFFIGLGLCDHRCGRCSDGGARRDHRRGFYLVHPLPAADDLVPDRSRIRRQSLPTRNRRLKRFNAILEAEPRIKDDEAPRAAADQGCRRISRPDILPTTANLCCRTSTSRSNRERPSPSSAKPAAANRHSSALSRGLLDAPDGSVLVDGRPVREYPLEQLRRSIGFVPQETFLFSDTLAANICLRSRRV